MPGRPVGSELALDRVRGARRDVHEAVIAERTLPGDGRLDEMAEAVQLVSPREIPVFVAGRDDLDEGVEVAVRPLRVRDEGDDLVGGAGEAATRPPPELPADRFEPLVDVRIEEREDRADALADRAIASLGAGGEMQVPEVPGALELGEPMRDRPLAVRPHALRPQAAADAHCPWIQRRQGRDRAGRRTHGWAAANPAGRGTGRHLTAPLVNPDT